MRTFHIEKTDSQYVVTWRHFTVIAFNSLMLIVFSPLLCIIALDNVLNGENFAIDLVGLVVLIGLGLWIFAVAVNGFFGKTRLVLNEHGVEIIWSCLFLISRRWINLPDIRQFKKIGEAKWYSRLRVVWNNRNADYITPAGFLTPKASKKLDTLCDELNAFLEMLKAKTPQT
jgi:hypothetical protein